MADIRYYNYNIILNDKINFKLFSKMYNELANNCWVDKKAGLMQFNDVENNITEFIKLLPYLRLDNSYIHIEVNTNNLNWLTKNIKKKFIAYNVSINLDTFKVPENIDEILLNHITLHISHKNIESFYLECKKLIKMPGIKYAFKLDEEVDEQLLKKQINKLFMQDYYDLFQRDTIINLCENINPLLFSIILYNKQKTFKNRYKYINLLKFFNKDIKSWLTITPDMKVYVGNWKNIKAINDIFYICDYKEFAITINSSERISTIKKQLFDDKLSVESALDINCKNCGCVNSCTADCWETNYFMYNQVNLAPKNYCILNRILLDSLYELIHKLDEEKNEFFKEDLYFRYENEFK